MLKVVILELLDGLYLNADSRLDVTDVGWYEAFATGLRLNVQPVVVLIHYFCSFVPADGSW